MCDTQVGSCKQWAKHCKATHTIASWVAERQKWKDAGGLPVAASASGATSSSTTSAAAPARFDISTRWKVDEILAKVQMVYPIESPEPAGFAPGITLRPYQKQSLAFMLQTEQSNDATLAGDNGVRGGWLCDEVG